MLTHALLFIFGKALLGFFSVVDSVSCLDSESVGIDSKMVLDSESELLKLEFKLSLDSESVLHSARGFALLGVDCVSSLLQAKKLVIAVGLVEFLAGLGVGAT